MAEKYMLRALELFEENAKLSTEKKERKLTPLESTCLLLCSTEFNLSQEANKAKDLVIILAHLEEQLFQFLQPVFTSSVLVGFSSLSEYKANARYVINQSSKTLPLLRGHLEAITNHFCLLFQGNDKPDLKTEPTLSLVECYRLILRIIRRILSWHGLRNGHDDYHHLKSQTLRLLVDDEIGKIHELTNYCFGFVEKFHTYTPNFACAVEHVRLAEVILLHHQPKSDHSLFNRLAELSIDHLQKRWTEVYEQGKDRMEIDKGIKYLLQVYLLNGSNGLDKVRSILNVAVPVVSGTSETDYLLESQSLPICNGSNCIIFFITSLRALAKSAKEIPLSCGDSIETQFASWERVLILLYTVAVNVKHSKRRSVLKACLKYGSAIVSFFIQLAMPLLDKKFETFQTESLELLRNLQKVIPLLDQIFRQAKFHRYLSLAAHLPAWTECQEVILSRVRTLLAVNGYNDEFWMVTEDDQSSSGQIKIAIFCLGCGAQVQSKRKLRRHYETEHPVSAKAKSFGTRV